VTVLATGAGTRTPAWAELASVFGAAFLIRIAHAWFVSQTPFFEGPIIDAHTYRMFAEHLSKTGNWGGAFYQPPLYPAFLGLLFAAGLHSSWAISIVQSAMGSATAALMVLVGRRLAGEPARARSAGLLTGFATALYGPLVFYDLELLPPALLHLLLASSLVLALHSRRFGVADVGIGLGLGLSIVAWPLSAVLVPGLLVLRARRLPAGRRLLALLVTFACLVLPSTLTAQHNARENAPGVIVSYNSGINLWLGNNPNWRDTWQARPGARFEPEFERPDREGVTKSKDRSKYFARLALRDAIARPGAALTRTAEKFYYVWHGREIRRNQDIAAMRDASPILRAAIWEVGIAFPFGIVAPLALLALWRRRREPDVRIIAATLLSYALVLAAFFVSARYRLPLALLLLPFAADQCLALVHAGRNDWKTWAALVALAVPLNLPNAFTAGFAADRAERGILEVQAWRNQGNLERAERLSAELVSRFEADANVQMLRAEVLIAFGRCREAAAHLNRVIVLAPRAATPRVMLASCLDELGDPAGAERAFAAALALHPHHPVALKRAGSMYARYGRVIEAHALLTRFVESGYQDAEVDELLQQLAPERRRAIEAGPARLP
jgi:tetratricopeptide (TPR) repeat protein